MAISRISGFNALRRLLVAATYRDSWLVSPAEVSHYTLQCAELLRRTSVWELRRPKDWAGTESMLNLLEDHWTRS